MVVKQIYKYISAVILFATFSACNSTKYVPEGKSLLMKNTIYVNGKKTNAEELHEILKQDPNKKIIFDAWKPYLGLYNWGNPEKEKGLASWFTRIGEPPTIIDSLLVLKSSKQLGMYAFGKGYFHTVNMVKVEPYRRSKNKVNVSYYLYTGKPYFFGTIDHLIYSEGIEKLVKENLGNSLIKFGDHYDSDILEKERNRLVGIFRDRGYFGFQKNFIRYEADTSGENNNVNLKMIISDKPIYYQDSTVMMPHKPYRISDIYIDPNFDYSSKQEVKDTTVFETYIILKRKGNRYKSDLFTSSIHFNPGDIYDESKVNASYTHLTSLKVFRSSEIEFTQSEEDPYELKASIKLKPFPKHSITLELEGTNTSGNYGILGSVSYLNRGLFKRGEIFDITLRGGFEAQASIAKESDEPFNSFEYGVEFGVNFPRFLIPYKWQKKFPKRMIPKSRVSTSVGRQNRQEFQRIYFNVGLGYSWKETEKKSHQIQLVDINYLYLPYIDPNYLKSLEFVRGYDDALIWATRYTFTYNDQKFGKSVNRSYFSGSIEIAGNFLSILDGAIGFQKADDGVTSQLFGVSYAQYWKIDLDYRNYTKLNRDQQLAWRMYVGYNHTYGNTQGAPPFEKSYFAGGSNDIRGWFAYKLGPGNFPKEYYNSSDTFYYSATGPIKLMFNVEYRFPIISAFKGAIFMDMGNIWFYNRPITEDIEGLNYEELKFKWENITQQIAMSPGVGLRYDFGFFVFRLDGAYKLFDPTSPEGERLLPYKLGWDTITYNLAIGYPF